VLTCVFDAQIWFRVPSHHAFDPDLVYRAVAIADYGEAKTAQVFLVNERGWLWGVRQNECLCVTPLWREGTPEERSFVLPERGTVKSDFPAFRPWRIWKGWRR